MAQRGRKAIATSRLAVPGLAFAAMTSLAGCAGNRPIAVTPITAAEHREGAAADPQMLAEFGGEMTGPQADYVRQVGAKIAAQSGLGKPGAFDIALLNSSVDNAFAMPGGYVYVTRQLVSLMNDEAELAAVLGHEVGHVAARHSAQREQAAQRNSVFGALGQILSSAMLGNSALGELGQQLASSAPQLATLSFSRSQELEADALGIEYLDRAGYDPHAMSAVLASLAAQDSLDAALQGRDDAVPEWASTHPEPASRVQSADDRAGSAGGSLHRDAFLAHIDGLVYGDDPEQGIVEGRQFIHPVFRLAFIAPEGFYLLNGTDAVSVTGNGGRGQLATAAYQGDLPGYVRGVLRGLGQTGDTLSNVKVRKTTVHGIPATFATARIASGREQLDVTVFAYEFSDSQAVHFATIVPAGSQVFGPMFRSMRRLDDDEVAAVVPRRIAVVTVARGDTVESLAARMAFGNARVERFRVLNGLAADATLKPGQKVKIVVRRQQ